MAGRLSENPLGEWRVQINNRQDLVTDPDAQRQRLADLAMLACRRRQVSAEELNDMLELGDAARLWGLLELEEADAIGLFDSGRFADEGAQVIRGRGRG